MTNQIVLLCTSVSHVCVYIYIYSIYINIYIDLHTWRVCVYKYIYIYTHVVVYLVCIIPSEPNSTGFPGWKYFSTKNRRGHRDLSRSHATPRATFAAPKNLFGLMIRAYENPLVSLKVLLNPYFWGGVPAMISEAVDTFS